MTTILKNGEIVTSAKSYRADLMIEGEKITQIGPDLKVPGAQVLDVAGCKLFPGFIDAHTHLDMDNGQIFTADDFASGTRAALAGGTTAIVDFATQTRGDTLANGLAEWHRKADGKAYCDYGFHMAITDFTGRTPSEIGEMAEAGVTSFKVYMAYDNLRLSDGDIFALLCRVKEIGGIVSCHCENGDLVNALIQRNRAAGNLSPHYHPLSRPDYIEGEAVARFCAIGRAAEAPVYIVHLSTKAGLEEALRARHSGQTVALETCPQYLALEDSRYDLPDFEGAKCVCSPPLRKEEDKAALWAALADGTIDTVATDHCSYNFAGQKDLGREDFSRIPNGLPGIEHRPALLWGLGVATGKLTENRMVQVLAETPAKMFGLYPRKGVLEVGSDADIVVWDPDRKHTLTAKSMYQRVDYTPYEGLELTGRAGAVFLRGKQVVTDGQVTDAPQGIYLHRGKAIV